MSAVERPIFDSLAVWSGLSAGDQELIGAAALELVLCLHGQEIIDDVERVRPYEAAEPEAFENLITMVLGSATSHYWDTLAQPLPLPPKIEAGPGICRECQCTDDHACEGGCYWVEPDLCSACAGDGRDLSAPIGAEIGGILQPLHPEFGVGAAAMPAAEHRALHGLDIGVRPQSFYEVWDIERSVTVTWVAVHPKDRAWPNKVAQAQGVVRQHLETVRRVLVLIPFRHLRNLFRRAAGVES
jgi:hypothetical protein